MTNGNGYRANAKNEYTHLPATNEILTISVELCKLVQSLFYAYTNYHLSCIGDAGERPKEKSTYLIYMRTVIH